MTLLQHGFLASAKRAPQRTAVREADDQNVSYAELDALTSRMRDALVHAGVKPRDRVGVYVPKSIDSVVPIFATLRAGAAYVPIDPMSPPARAAYILADCSVTVVVTTRALVESLAPALAATGATPTVIVLDHAPGGQGVSSWLDAHRTAVNVADVSVTEHDPAYILYTSGSTGNPKGVVVSHCAAVAFVNWCNDTFEPNANDRFSSHAPFHFDLSIHDLYVSLGCGASVSLIGEELGKDPKRLAAFMASEAISIWYSTPSILSLLEEHGRLDRHEFPSLRIVLFAGEVFPIPRLRAVMQRFPTQRFANLYGPTETNVCTWYEVPQPLPDDRTESLPIGAVCAHYRSRIVQDGKVVHAGERGELLMTGPGIMTGYWNLPDRNATAFHVDPDGTTWYRTGDIVSEQPDGALLFHGRRDRMVKRMGYRIELGEIESGLARHPALGGVAVVAVSDPATGVKIHAFLVSRDSERPSVVDLKGFCARELPRFMVPDRFQFLDAIPQTSTDKADYKMLERAA